MPGSVLTSSTNGSPAVEIRRSGRAWPLQPSALYAASASCSARSTTSRGSSRRDQVLRVGALVLRLVVVELRRRADLDRAEHAAVEDADEHLGAGDVVLDDHRAVILARARRAPPASSRAILDDRLTPTELPSFAGLTTHGSGQVGERVGVAAVGRAVVRQQRQRGVGTPLLSKIRFDITLSIASALARMPEPVHGEPQARAQALDRAVLAAGAVQRVPHDLRRRRPRAARARLVPGCQSIATASQLLLVQRREHAGAGVERDLALGGQAAHHDRDALAGERMDMDRRCDPELDSRSVWTRGARRCAIATSAIGSGDEPSTARASRRVARRATGSRCGESREREQLGRGRAAAVDERERVLVRDADAAARVALREPGALDQPARRRASSVPSGCGQRGGCAPARASSAASVAASTIGFVKNEPALRDSGSPDRRPCPCRGAARSRCRARAASGAVPPSAMPSAFASSAYLIGIDSRAARQLEPDLEDRPSASLPLNTLVRYAKPHSAGSNSTISPRLAIARADEHDRVGDLLAVRADVLHRRRADEPGDARQALDARRALRRPSARRSRPTRRRRTPRPPRSRRTGRSG